MAKDFVVVRADALEFLRGLPSASIGTFLTDFAYESLERHRAVGTTTRLSRSSASSNDWFDTFPNDRVPELLVEMYRTLIGPNYALMFCDDPTEEILRPAARNAGFWVWGAWTWVKIAKNQDKARSEEEPVLRTGMGYHGLKCTERILLLEKRTKKQVSHAEWTVRTNPKGDGRKLNVQIPEVLFFARSDGDYPTEKPVPLLQKLLTAVGSSDGPVCDPFCGSGSTAEAALRLDLSFVGSDISDKAVDLTESRCSTACKG